MSVKYFLDTNILVYSFDRTAPEKQKRAVNLIDAAIEEGAGVISSQVVQEFLNVATKKFSVKLTRRDVHMCLEDILLPLCAVYPSPSIYARSLDISEETGLSFYDSMIIAGAKESGCGVVYSEDLQHGRTVGGLKIVDPFKG